ncbi:MAG: 5-dehydro-2-deoxygluconokinase, partial [Trueperaceae bacterium]|nr:5-dehydro-2-deoxygluconokinase [Trueperaceae bacterium]
FPLVFYRDNAADMELGIDHVLASPVDRTRAFEFSGTGLSREPSRSATIFAAERARAVGAIVYLDLDFRADQWHDPRAYGVTVRSVLPLVDVIIGTEEEVMAAMLTDPARLRIIDGQMSAPHIVGDVEADISALLAAPGAPNVLVVKRGDRGATVHQRGEGVVTAPGFPVEVHNVLGAGDAFAAGLIYGRTHGWDWYRSARMGNACGAIVVTRHGCANFMGYEDEVLSFVAERGGFGSEGPGERGAPVPGG